MEVITEHINHNLINKNYFIFIIIKLKHINTLLVLNQLLFVRYKPVLQYSFSNCKAIMAYKKQT